MISDLACMESIDYPLFLVHVNGFLTISNDFRDLRARLEIVRGIAHRYLVHPGGVRMVSNGLALRLGECPFPT